MQVALFQRSFFGGKLKKGLFLLIFWQFLLLTSVNVDTKTGYDSTFFALAAGFQKSIFQGNFSQLSGQT